MIVLGIKKSPPAVIVDELAKPDPFEGLTPEARAMVVTLLSLIQALQWNVLSGDVWELSIAAARKHAETMGVDNETFKGIMVKLEVFRKRQRDRNPMSSMF